MSAKPFSIAIVCPLLLMIAGCAKVRYPNYYTLSIAPAMTADATVASRPITVGVRRFETPAYLRQGRIVYSEAPGKIGFYEYHRWAVEPGAAVTTAVIESIRSGRLFSVVEPYDGHDRPDYLITGRLERLDEIDYGGEVKVEARISAELVNLRTGSVVWTGDADGTSKVDRREVDTVVAEMSHALQGSISQLLTGMERQVPEAQVSSR